MEIDTKVVHAGQHPEPSTGAISPPIYQGTTFAFKDADHGARLFKKEEAGYIYTRLANPTIDLLVHKLAILESAEDGLAFSSGSAAIFSVMLALVGAGNNLISDNIIYGGSYAQFADVLPKAGISTTFVDTTDASVVESAIKPNTRLIFIETPANPTLKIIDIAKCAQIAHKHNILLVVDNTFATPYLQRPIEHGADIVIHSMTKYLCGHGDAIGGIVVGKAELINKMASLKNLGACITPFGAWLILRGIKTLAVRMERHSKNAMEVAKFLSTHPKVAKVYYPGLSSHPGHHIASRQMSTGSNGSAFGGMLSFELKGGKEAAKLLMNSVKLCTLAVSLGDTDTLIEHPASMTHHAYSEEECLKVGITPGLVRMSIGIENAKDIIADLAQALTRE